VGVVSKLGSMRWYQLIALWLVGCLVLLILGLAQLPQNSAFVLFPLPSSLRAIGYLASGLWAYSPGFAMSIFAIPVFTIAVIIVRVRYRFAASAGHGTSI